MFFWSVYDAESGRVLRAGHCDEIQNVAIQSSSSTEIVLGEELDSETEYVVEHERTPRPRLVATDTVTILAGGVGLFRIDDVPPVTTLILDAVSHVVDDGTIEITRALPGIFIVTLLPPFPWQEQRVGLIANEV